MTHEITEEGVFVDGTRVFVTFDRGNLWAMTRATDKDTFDALALEVGLKVHKNPAQPAVIDPVTEEVIREAVEASGPLVPAKGVTIAEMGPHVITPGEYDEDGNEITAPVMDERYHVNFWLAPWLVQRGAWEGWALAWTLNGTEAPSNAQEVALDFRGIELIDPSTIRSPSNKLL